MNTRLRAILIGVSSLILAGCGSGGGLLGEGDTTNAMVPTQAGCYSNLYNDPTAIGGGILPSFGNALFDQQMYEEVNIQTRFWGVAPVVYIFDDGSSPNALSLPSGAILYGYYMFYRVVFQDGSTASNAGILAHEWAHQIQFQYGWQMNNEPTARRTELEADAFSTFYLVLAKHWDARAINVYFGQLFSLGDYNFNSQGHHGTPNQRVAAGQAGVDVAAQVLSNGTPLNYGELHALFGRAIDEIILGVSRDSDLTTAAMPSEFAYEAYENLDVNRVLNALAGGNIEFELPAVSMDESYVEQLYPSSMM